MDKLNLGGKNEYKGKSAPHSQGIGSLPAHSQAPQNSQNNSQIVNVNNGHTHVKSPIMSAPPPTVDLGKNNNAQFVNTTGNFLIFIRTVHIDI